MLDSHARGEPPRSGGDALPTQVGVPRTGTGAATLRKTAARASHGLGQLRLRWRQRERALDVQAVKSAVAAGLAWAVVSATPGVAPQPYLATTTALLTVQLTVAESVLGGLQRLLGVAVGVGFALGANHLMGVSPVTIGLVALLAQMLAAFLRLTPLGTSQMVTTAFVILTVGETTGGWSAAHGRIAETAIGVLVGIIVNGVLIPPSHLPEARQAWRALSDELHQQLATLQADLEVGLTAVAARVAVERAQHTVGLFDDTHAALKLADDSLRFNCFGAPSRRELATYRAAVAALERGAIQVASIAQMLAHAVDEPEMQATSVSWLRPDQLGMPLSRLLGSAAEMLRRFSTVVADSTPAAALEEARVAAAVQRLSLIDAARRRQAADQPTGWIALGVVLGSFDRLLEDLALPTGDLSPHPNVPPSTVERTGSSVRP
ncbi:MAG: FUSC family protein [Chloroflexi bacterium]|nr:FUSC family protein [Chloroflexota bacterium]